MLVKTPFKLVHAEFTGPLSTEKIAKLEKEGLQYRRSDGSIAYYIYYTECHPIKTEQSVTPAARLVFRVRCEKR